MKRIFIVLPSILSLSLFVLMGCGSAKQVQGNAAGNKGLSQQTANKCEQKVLFHIDKIRAINSGQEVNAHTMILIDPAAKLISMTSEPPNQEKVSFDTEIESIDCNLNADFTEGQSTYKGYIKQQDGTKTYSVMKIESKDGNLTISGETPGQQGLVMLVTRWEVINQ